MKTLKAAKRKDRSKNRFLTLAMRHSAKEARLMKRNLRYCEKRPPRFAGESDSVVGGETKSLVVRLQADNNQHTQFVALFEFLNDARAAISKEIEDDFKVWEKKGLDVGEAFKNYYKKWNVSNLAEGSLPFSAIREHAKDYLKRNPVPHGYDTVRLANWIGRDLDGKLKSYLELAHKNGWKDKANTLFADWYDDNGSQIAIDPEIASSVLGIEVSSTKQKAFKSALIKKALKDVGGKSRFKCLDFNLEDGKVTKVKGVSGIEEFNVLATQLNIFLGQYNGQLTQKALKILSEKYGQTFGRVKDVYKWAEGAGSEGQQAIQFFDDLRRGRLKTTNIIKNIAGFPTFKTTSEIINMDKPDLVALRNFDDLLLKIEEYPFDEERFRCHFNHERYQSDINESSSVQSKSSMSRSANLRLSRRIYFHNSTEKALNDEICYLKEKLKKCREALKVYVTANKLKQASFYAQRICQLMLNSRGGMSAFDKNLLDFRVKELFGNLQMQALKFSKQKQFSFQFRNWDQAGIYPVLASKNGRDRLDIYLQYKSNSESEREELIEYLSWKDDPNGGAKRILCRKSVSADEVFKINAMFSRRQGRKFLFNSILGLNSSTELSLSKLGTPNIVVKYNSKGEPVVSVVLSLTKQLFVPSGIRYPKNLRKEDARAKYLIENLKYLIGVDRGENKIFAVSVYDIESNEVVEQVELGGDFLTRVTAMKQKQAELQKEGRSKAKLRNITRRISNMIHHSTVAAVNDLLRIANHYAMDGLTGIVFEHISRDFRRTGRKAYVELNQMHEALKRVKQARNFFGFQFHIFEVGPAFTSQTCSRCGVIDASNRLGEEYKCKQCGYHGDADIQASLNIVYKWLAKRFKEIHGWEEDDKNALSRFIREHVRYAKVG